MGEWPTQFKKMSLAGSVLILGIVVVYVWVKQLNINALKTEAQVMLAYLGTLEAAYYTDSGAYAGFEEFYGSEIDGQENCQRPKGAEELGFRLKKCGKDPRAGGLRYAYRVLLQNDDYTGEAISGSDVGSESYICLGSQKRDQWQVNSDKKVRHTLDCE